MVPVGLPEGLGVGLAVAGVSVGTLVGVPVVGVLVGLAGGVCVGLLVSDFGGTMFCFSVTIQGGVDSGHFVLMILLYSWSQVGSLNELQLQSNPP